MFLNYVITIIIIVIINYLTHFLKCKNAFNSWNQFEKIHRTIIVQSIKFSIFQQSSFSYFNDLDKFPHFLLYYYKTYISYIQKRLKVFIMSWNFFISNQDMNFPVFPAILSRGRKFYFRKICLLLFYPSIYAPGILLQSTKVRSKIV